MTSWQDFFNGLNWWGLLDLLISAFAALFCITFHELSHGLAAYKLGDPTARNVGRLTLNPIKHIDPLGLLLLVTARVGWAKPVPVDMRYFKKPKRDMALTALAGPVSNFILALLAVLLSNLIFTLCALWGWAPSSAGAGVAFLVVLSFLANVALLSVGLGIFNLIPISPLDGSKVLYSFLPEKAYYTILRYERYVMLPLLLLTWFGVFSKPLSFLMTKTLSGFCALTGWAYSLDDLLMLADLFDWLRF